MKPPAQRLRRDALAIFAAALRAADAGEAVRRHLSVRSGVLRAGDARIKLSAFDRIFVVGAGKAAASMALAVESVLGVSRLSCGVVSVKHGHTKPGLAGIQLQESGHPLPDRQGVATAQQIEALLRETNARDLVLVLISGGASALLPAPAAPITLRDKQRTTELLLRAGADIFELNAVRKHLSSLKGGRLAALAYPATVVSLLLSDVIGDPLDVIGSGPTAPDPSTYSDALRSIAKYSLTRKVPAIVLQHLEQGARGNLPETPKPGDRLFKNVHNVIVGSNRQALRAASEKAQSLGYRPLLLSSTMRGETREVAGVHAELVREILSSGNPAKPPICLLSGGETTVTVTGEGKGGRNQEFALAAAIQLSGAPRWLVLSGGTDGTDGPTDAAGAFADGATVPRAIAAGISPDQHLRENDSYAVFQSIEDLVKTGPTGTNVMDIHLFLVI